MTQRRESEWEEGKGGAKRGREARQQLVLAVVTDTKTQTEARPHTACAHEGLCPHCWLALAHAPASHLTVVSWRLSTKRNSSAVMMILVFHTCDGRQGPRGWQVGTICTMAHCSGWHAKPSRPAFSPPLPPTHTTTS